MKHLTIFFVTLLSFFVFSCNKEDLNKIGPSSTLVKFEGEGGQEEISFSNGNWQIAKVINQNNSQNIFGDIYSSNGSLIQENHILELDTLGRLEAFWPDKGFSIFRKTPTAIEIYLKENFTKKDFGFDIVLESGNELKRITVNQKPSQGYKIKDIEYSLEENDSDSIFVRQGKTYSFDISSSPLGFSFAPFANTFEQSHFESTEEAAFPWVKTESLMVRVPTGISDYDVLTNGENSPYCSEIVQKDSEFKEQIAKVTIPSGQSAFAVEIEYRKRRVTYTLHLINNRTNKDKIIKGKWVETAPSGKYVIDWK